MKKIISLTLILVVVSLVIVACTNSQDSQDNGKLNVVATTTIIGDTVKEIGGELINLETLMGPGIDPHLYNASAGDVSKMSNADMVIYNGLHLEGKMGDVFESIENEDKLIFAVIENIDESNFLDDEDTPGYYDPHIWFDVELWKQASSRIAEGLKELDEENADEYDNNLNNYMEKLDELDEYIRGRIEELSEDRRVLITAHDAFQYFGNAYDFEVRGLQGISTDAEAGTSNIRTLADFIVEREINAIFVESSVPTRNIEALQEAVSSRGFDVEIGGELYSDSTGSAGTEAESYIGTFRSNIDTIVDALK